MSQFKRRKFLKTSAGLAAGAAARPLIWVKDAHAQQWTSTPEKGAKLRVLRWSRFVQGDIDQYMKNVQAFQDKYKIDAKNVFVGFDAYKELVNSDIELVITANKPAPNIPVGGKLELLG